MNLQFHEPRPLTAIHRPDSFGCGETSLDEWLRRRAFANQLSGASRTFVLADRGGNIFAYYAMAAGAVSHREATGAVRRNMPDPVPVLVLGRLAVDRQAQGMKLGAALLQDAVKRAVGVSADARIRALLVHALSDRAKQFYLHYGFQASTLHPMTLMMRMPTA